MNGIVFSVIGILLIYVTFWVIKERLIDYQMGRDGTAFGVIFIIVLATATCVIFGVSALFGARWPMRLLLTLGVGLGRRWKRSLFASVFAPSLFQANCPAPKPLVIIRSFELNRANTKRSW